MDESDRVKTIKTCGVAMVVHGLNSKPSQMDDLAAELRALGILPKLLVLPGHGGIQELPVFKTATRATYLEAFLKKYEEAESLAQEKQCPLYFVGFSWGALLYLDALFSFQKKFLFQKALFFSPALSLRWYSHLLRGLWFFPPAFLIKSLAPSEIRVHDRTPLAAYKALFQSYGYVHESFRKLTGAIGENNSFQTNPFLIDTLIIIHRRDELISTTKLLRHLNITRKVNHTMAWKTLVLSEERPKTYYHMTVLRSFAGQKDWKQITEALQNFFIQVK